MLPINDADRVFPALLRSERRVAARHRRVACATHPTIDFSIFSGAPRPRGLNRMKAREASLANFTQDFSPQLRHCGEHVCFDCHCRPPQRRKVRAV